jgi:hypothetical protein
MKNYISNEKKIGKVANFDEYFEEIRSSACS